MGNYNNKKMLIARPCNIALVDVSFKITYFFVIAKALALIFITVLLLATNLGK